MDLVSNESPGQSIKYFNFNRLWPFVGQGKKFYLGSWLLTVSPADG